MSTKQNGSPETPATATGAQVQTGPVMFNFLELQNQQTGAKMVGVQMQANALQVLVVLSPEETKKIGRMFINAAEQAASLIVRPSGPLPPAPGGHA